MYEVMFDNLFKDALAGEKVGNARVTAAITDGSGFTSFGRNRRKSHPFQKRFGTTEECIFLHAEIEAIHNFLKRNKVLDLQASDLFIMRVKQESRRGPMVTGLSKPCEGCMRAIVEFEIGSVYYTEDNASTFSCL